MILPQPFCRALRTSLLLSILAAAAPAFSQESSDPAATPTPAQQPQPSTIAASDRRISLRTLPANLLADQKDIWLFPGQLAKAKHWLPTVTIVGATSALVASDPSTAPNFRTTNRFSGFNRVFSGVNTGAFVAVVPASIYAFGLVRKDSYAQSTALLAAEAFADGFVLDLVFKGITGRKQPLQYAGNGPYTDSFFNGTHNPFHSGGFYSVHAMSATAVAAVIAHRYRKHRWVPFVAYGMAGAICFSRITGSTHFPSDVFFGGAMGFVIARYAVLPGR
ncbi:MAG: phosphatase PAP2 family protein [Candidatus Acidiferrales bacterium]